MTPICALSGTAHLLVDEGNPRGAPGGRRAGTCRPQPGQALLLAAGVEGAGAAFFVAEVPPPEELSPPEELLPPEELSPFEPELLEPPSDEPLAAVESDDVLLLLLFAASRLSFL